MAGEADDIANGNRPVSAPVAPAPVASAPLSAPASPSVGMVGGGPAERNDSGPRSGAVGGFLGNNGGLFFGAIVAALAIFGTDGGIMSWLFAGAALIAGYANDEKNPNSLIGNVMGFFKGDKKPDGPSADLSLGSGSIPAKAAATSITPAPSSPLPSSRVPDSESVGPKEVLDPPVVVGRVPAPKAQERVGFNIDKDGKLVTAGEGKGLLRITAFVGDNAKEIVAGYVATANDAGKFTHPGSDGSEVSSDILVEKKIILPLTKDGYIDIDSPAFKENLVRLREIAEGKIPAVERVAPQVTVASAEAATTEGVVVGKIKDSESSFVVTELPEQKIIVSGNIKPTIFLMNNKGERLAKEEAGAIKVIATSEGRVISIATAGENGKFATDKMTGGYISKPVDGVVLPVHNGVIDLTDSAVKEKLESLKKIADPQSYNIIPADGNPMIFMVDKNGKKTDKLEAGVMQVLATRDGHIIGFSIADQNGDFQKDAKGNTALIPITALTNTPGVEVGPARLPIKDGFVDLDASAVKARLQYLRDRAPEASAKQTSSIQQSTTTAMLGGLSPDTVASSVVKTTQLG